MKRFIRLISGTTAAIIMLSCSATRNLQDGEFRLAKNKIEVVNDEEFDTGSLNPYIKQKHKGWSPFLYIYNWTNGKEKGWDKFVRKIGTAPVIYDPVMVDNSIESIDDHLEYLGYYGSRTTSEIDVRKKNVVVTYKVNLGNRVMIRDIEVNLPERGEFSDAFRSDSSAFAIRPGDFLSESALESESVRSAEIMRNKGFYTFNKNNYFFEADTISFPGSAILKLTVNEYTRNELPRDAEPIRRFKINDVSITYPKTMKVREKVLEDLNLIKPGENYSERIVNNTYSRFSSLKMFSTVNVGMTQVDTNLVNCEISLSQSKTQGFKVNLEASSNSSGLLGVSPQISYYHKNIFRGGEWLNLSFMGNFQFMFNDDVHSNEFGVSGGLSLPKFLFLPYRMFKGSIPRTDFNLSYNYQNRPEYTRNMLSTSFGYNGNIRNRFFYQVYPAQLNVVKLFNLDDNFYKTLANDPFLRNAYQNHFDLGSGATLYYTTNSAVNPQDTYFYSRLQFDIAGNILRAFSPVMKKDSNGSGMIWNTPFSQFVRGELTLGQTWVFGRNSGHSLATRLLAGAGYAYGNSNALPFEKHFYGGGANSLRGWQARTVGPGCSPRDTSFVIPNQTGDMKLEANIEYRFKVVWKLAGAVFLDAGNVWTLRNDSTDNQSAFRWSTFGQSIAANWGAGVRLDLGFLLLRVDMGMKIHDPSRVNKWVGPQGWFSKGGYAMHFGVGYPF
ncbi:MAG: BamA/TamA family outer membrane protein [Bacteroidales bacterium]|nr:BamA/TamA family outer membrane protein [Bacteroidales bacterium]